jgi:hypothetical protein
VRTGEEVGGESRAFSFTVDKARMARTADLPPHARKLRKEALAALRGLTGSYQIDSLGMVRDVVMKLPSDASAELSGMAEDLKWALRQLAAPFPKEPIGMGATWTASRGVEQDGVHATELSTLAIAKLENRLITITTKVRQNADPQKLQSPGSTVDVVITQFSGDGAGEITWNPIERVPRSANVTSTVTKQTTFESEGKPMNGILVARRTLTIDGPKR